MVAAGVYRSASTCERHKADPHIDQPSLRGNVPCAACVAERRVAAGKAPIGAVPCPDGDGYLRLMPCPWVFNCPEELKAAAHTIVDDEDAEMLFGPHRVSWGHSWAWVKM